MTDEVLVARHLQGDPEAFNQLAERHQDLIYRVTLRMLGNHEDALDAVQEVLLRLLRALPRFRGESRFSTWLYRLAANTAIDMHRRRQSRVQPVAVDPDLSVEAPNSDPDHQCETAFREHLLNEALKQMEESQRLLLVLRDREGLTNEEVAGILGIKVGTLKARLHRARGALRRLLESGVQVKDGGVQGRFVLTAHGLAE